MTLVDSHCHLHLLDLNHHPGGVDAVVQEAKNAGVEHLLCVSVALKDAEIIASYLDRYPQVYGSIGVHPNETTTPITEDNLCDLAAPPKVIAIGETGLDYYRDKTEAKLQQQRFITHIAASKALHKPLIVHTRAAKSDTIKILKQENANRVGGVLHCFTEDWPMAKAALDLDFYISFSGIITFKNAKDLQEVVRQVPLDRILIETDCPYLAPVPYRGKPNQPAYVHYVAEQIALLKGIDFDEVAAITTQNFGQLFNIAIT